MVLGTTIAIAAGLNPYVTALIVAALAGLASRVQVTGPLASVDPTMWRTAIAFAAILAGIDLTVGKLRHRFLTMRLASFGFAVVTGGGGAVIGIGDVGDPLVVAAAGAFVAASTSVAVTLVARASMASRTWLRLGHIPVMMMATVVAAVAVPLTLAFGWPGTVLAGVVATVYTAAAARSRFAPKPPAPNT